MDDVRHQLALGVDAKQGMALAYRSGDYTMREVALEFGVHEMTVSRAVRKFESESPIK